MRHAPRRIHATTSVASVGAGESRSIEEGAALTPVGQQLAELRKAKGLSLRKVAAAANLSYEAVRRLESVGGLLSSAEAIAAALKHKLVLLMDGRPVHFPGSLGMKLANVRRVLGKNRKDIVGLAPTTIRDIEDSKPIRLVSVELYAALLSGEGAVFTVEVKPLNRYDRKIMKAKEHAHVHARSHC